MGSRKGRSAGEGREALCAGLQLHLPPSPAWGGWVGSVGLSGEPRVAARPLPQLPGD